MGMFKIVLLSGLLVIGISLPIYNHYFYACENNLFMEPCDCNQDGDCEGIDQVCLRQDGGCCLRMGICTTISPTETETETETETSICDELCTDGSCCDGLNEICIQNGSLCCDQSNICNTSNNGQECCSNLQVCLNGRCQNQQQCGCPDGCGDNETCINNECCSNTQVCAGTTCCDQDSQCLNNETCCKETLICDEECCSDSETCINNESCCANDKACLSEYRNTCCEFYEECLVYSVPNEGTNALCYCDCAYQYQCTSITACIMNNNITNPLLGQCVSGTCCDKEKACGLDCCSENQTCTLVANECEKCVDNYCGQDDDGKNCYSDRTLGTCINGECCPKEYACNDNTICCSGSSERCRSDQCIDTCGDALCPGSLVCCNHSNELLCCGINEDCYRSPTNTPLCCNPDKICFTACCGEGSSCCNGECCPGECSPDTPECCPAGSSWCEGKCCDGPCCTNMFGSFCCDDGPGSKCKGDDLLGQVCCSDNDHGFCRST